MGRRQPGTFTHTPQPACFRSCTCVTRPLIRGDQAPQAPAIDRAAILPGLGGLSGMDGWCCEMGVFFTALISGLSLGVPD